ncbi:hypothetical protein Pelo_18284 [Pelomyxa schiedti]|nr:hypothetical protein Pelo_18284 [Pelomyxa schiedti]
MTYILVQKSHRVLVNDLFSNKALEAPAVHVPPRGWSAPVLPRSIRRITFDDLEVDYQLGISEGTYGAVYPGGKVAVQLTKEFWKDDDEMRLMLYRAIGALRYSKLVVYLEVVESDPPDASWEHGRRPTSWRHMHSGSLIAQREGTATAAAAADDDAAELVVMEEEEDDVVICGGAGAGGSAAATAGAHGGDARWCWD